MGDRIVGSCKVHDAARIGNRWIWSDDVCSEERMSMSIEKIK